MDPFVVAIITGLIAVAYAVIDVRRRAARKNPLAATSRAPKGRILPAPLTPEKLSSALYAHAETIENFVEKSSHPRELLGNDAFKAAAVLLDATEVTPAQLRQYATGASWPLTCVALYVLAMRANPELPAQTVIAQMPQMRPWTIYFALRYLCFADERPPVGAPLVIVQSWWRDNVIIPDAFREYFDLRQQNGDKVTFGDSLETLRRAKPEDIDILLYRIEHPSANTLRWQLRQWQETRIDRPFLSTVGRFWEKTTEDDLLVVPDAWRDRVVEASAAILSEQHRSVLANGEPRVGKTSFLKLVGQLLAREGWTVFEATGAELMAGQIYIGQLEERIRTIVAGLDARKKVVWYVPDLLQLAESGTHRGQSASILDQIFAAVNAGSLAILSEASPSGVVRLFQMRPSMRGAMEVFRFQPMSETETSALVRDVAQRIERAGSLTVAQEAIDSVLHLSHQYLGSTQLPGMTVDLLKRSATHAVSAGRKIVTADDARETLSQLSGLPRSILDDNQRLDLKAVKAEFTARVIGQDEAVNAVIDRIAMLKAGLVDPGRPIGVFLFAGPTGTGKTELAKTLAAYLFGSPDRMARLDMSELQTADSTVKVMGGGGADSDSLAEKIRKQPFSVVLLDEFEKAHSNVWDLFLQVFDDGRLTDANGRPVDFRHTIIVLTTNLGATTHQASVIGFGRAKGAYAPDQIMQAVSRTFRPEFVNRLDKILVFRPLSREFMRQILEKELALVLERRGLRQRDWAVEWEDSAIAFLLDRGFSPDMGARPLRRAIDEHLLAPLAATMVEHRFPAGDQFLFVRSDGHAVQVEFIDPDAKDETKTVVLSDDDSEHSLARTILNPAGDAAESGWLQQGYAGLVRRLQSPEWTALKDSLLASANASDIWQRKDRTTIFSRLELMERISEAARTAGRLSTRFGSTRGKHGNGSRELAARLALQLHLVSLGIEDAMSEAPVDALLTVEPVLGGESNEGQSRAWCEQVAAMYRNWSKLRHMQLVEIASGDGMRPDILQITGFGAYRTLCGEAGLHVLETGEGGARQVARVRMAAGPKETQTLRDPYGALAALLSSAGDNAMIVRRYRTGASPLVRDAKKGWRSGKLDAVLAGNFDLIGMLRVSADV
jgi:ATP-dependent Clp protease ATP-binding subunit ClpC